MTRFTDLSEDVILLIAEHLGQERDLNCLVRASRSLYGVLNARLYSQHVRFHKSWALTWAANHDRIDTAKRLLAAGADVLARTTDEIELPPIVIAARSNSLAMMKLLCETEGVDPDWADEETSPAIVWAVEFGYEDMAGYLLAEPRVDPERQDDFGRTPLTYAAEHRQPKTVEMLLRDPRVDPMTAHHHGRTALSFAAWTEKDNVEVIRLLLADPRVDPHHVDSDGCTALTLAADGGSAQNLRVMIETGLDANHCDHHGVPPLSYAAINGNEECMKILLSTPGVDPNLADMEGNTPLLYSTNHDLAAGARLLLSDDRVLPNPESQDGVTPLISVAMSGNDGLMHLFLVHPDTDLNRAAEDGGSALHSAIEYNYYNGVKMLIEDVRFDPERVNGSDFPPITYAAGANCGDIVKLLCEDGRFPVDDMDDTGRSALSYAVETNAVETVKLLLEKMENLGLDPCINIEDSEGLTPWDYAEDYGHEEVTTLMGEFLRRHPSYQEGWPYRGTC